MRLIFRNDDLGPRHYLEDQPVHCGTVLRLKVSSGYQPDFWVWARYEANLNSRCPSVMLYTPFGRLLPDEHTELRWPKENER